MACSDEKGGLLFPGPFWTTVQVLKGCSARGTGECRPDQNATFLRD
jgi:hypothetical protein